VASSTGTTSLAAAPGSDAGAAPSSPPSVIGSSGDAGVALGNLDAGISGAKSLVGSKKKESK
jgi:hypothetical protein